MPASGAATRERLALDVGFATISLELDCEPCRVLITVARSGEITDAGQRAMEEFLDFLTDSPRVPKEFALVYDFRQADWVASIIWTHVRSLAQWACDPSRHERWTRQCIGWRIVVPDDMSGVRQLLWAMFSLEPPPWRTLVAATPWAAEGDPDAFVPGLSAETVRRLESRGVDCYMSGPEQLEQQQPEWLTRVGEAIERYGYPSGIGCVLSVTDLLAEALAPLLAGAEPASAEPTEAPEARHRGEARPPRTLDLDALHIAEEVCQKTGRPTFSICGRDTDGSMESLEKALAFLDAVSRDLDRDFATQWDFRRMRTPSIEMIRRVAAWGAEEARQARWQRLHASATVILPPGNYYVTKAVLDGFFYISPPSCQICLKTDPDEPEETAVQYLPLGSCPCRDGAAASPGGSDARAAG